VGDFHAELIGEIKRIVAAQVPERYLVRLEERSYVALAGLLEAGAMTMQAFVAEEHREAFIEIYEDNPERRLVTCVEVLSPANKRKKSKGRKLYLRKRQSLLLGTANLVEIDLLRGGERMPMRGDWPDSPSCSSRRGHSHRLAAAHRRHLRPLPLPPRRRLP
jgi:hypothetical protein